MIRRPPRSTRTDTLFPYTTRFRSFQLAVQDGVGGLLVEECRPAASAAVHRTDRRAAIHRVQHPRGINGLVAQQRRTLAGGRIERRSEEHTSELQSLMRTSYAVFCLKKKKINYKQNHIQRMRMNHT